MLDSVPACFRGGSAAAPPVSTAAGPTLTTSIYETNLGLAALTWSRTVLGLSLRVELRLPTTTATSTISGTGAAPADASSVSSSAVSDYAALTTLRFRVRPWLLWKRRGTRRFHVKDQGRTVDFAWDLTRSVFPSGGGPEPSSGFYVAIAVDGEIFLVVGDSEEEAYRKTKTKRPITASRRGSPANPTLVSRREHVVLPESAGPYSTRAKIGGREREISVDLGGGGDKDARMCIGVDGRRVLNVKRLRWKFRGNERVELEPPTTPQLSRVPEVQVSWDVHNWLFPNRAAADALIPTTAAPAAPVGAKPELGHALFVFRFDRDEEKEQRMRGSSTPGSGGSGVGLWGFCDIGTTGSLGGEGRRRRGRSLLKTRSSSSSASTASSTGSGSSVMEWASAEENELKESEGFSLLVCVWRR